MFANFRINDRIGWFNFKEKEITYYNSFIYVRFQYYFAPSVLDNAIFHKEIICSFPNTNQLKEFVFAHEEYQLIYLDEELNLIMKKKE